MFAKAASRLIQANKLAIMPKRNYNGVVYQFSPPKNSLKTEVSRNLTYKKNF